MMKSDQKWLDRSTKTGAHQPQIPINPAFETRSRAKVCVKGPNHSTDGKKGLFKAQISRNVEGRPFYLGDVGLVFKTLSDTGGNIGPGAEGLTGTVGNNQAGPPNPMPQGPIQ